MYIKNCFLITCSFLFHMSIQSSTSAESSILYQSNDAEEVNPSESPLPASNALFFHPNSRQFLDQQVSRRLHAQHSGSAFFAHPTFELRTTSECKRRRKRYAVVAISDSLTDIVMNVSEAQLASLGLTKGASFPIDDEVTKKILNLMETVQTSKHSGGSPTNTIFSCSSLGLKCAYVGCVGNDDNGYDYINSLRTNDIDTYVSIKKGNSAVCYTFITPDGQRSFGLDFGVTKQLEEYEILHSLIEEAQFLHFSAYELRGDTSMSKATMHAVEHARENGTQISIDMGDAFLIETCFDKLMELFQTPVDIIFANEEEANALCKILKEKRPELFKSPVMIPQSSDSQKKTFQEQEAKESSSSSSSLITPTPVHPDEQSSSSSASQTSPSLQPSASSNLLASVSPSLSSSSTTELPTIPEDYMQLLRFCQLLIVKFGEKGSVAIRRKDRKIAYCPAYKVDCVRDTNGAGDNFQAGFFYGYFRALSLPTSLKIGSFLASKVIGRGGAQPSVQISGIEYLI
ncbi:putative PfkB domain-containing protein [Monocercomonoides exilis]|uniref:putative PfkB domain-containing protein n=1 Tax=Monocercomonoides exilis TaxID=2049356 RepID=UPI00355996C4|nr:putative PfkB domain-containing protein [Monocercomonoides exilis]|eukprot:MONOS_7085.1-p1 / transcript=MONOS_7085.1 / gene=MONOS_7085 / organism=Monocercomonoides_exilis_PA203 / gene_product=PfkB domain-containing protein / transcript_product=PfkB domain-containing protein / location=Mono_scaffold00235:18857-20605(+) / protein_length=514 / sequence_SO=supercontig / SO=protein_coding / is_pseudo=false